MAETLDKTENYQIIAGAFSSEEAAEKAAVEFSNLGYFGNDVEIITKENPQVPSVEYYGSLTQRGIVAGQAAYYSKAVDAGKTVVLVYSVTDPAPVIDIFNRFGADYNPSGERNLREDVVGMTLGAAVGAVALGAAGAVVGGPVGAVVGVSAGAVVGGVSGGALGVSAEHSK